MNYVEPLQNKRKFGGIRRVGKKGKLKNLTKRVREHAMVKLEGLLLALMIY